jgi:hypothetical protein
MARCRAEASAKAGRIEVSRHSSKQADVNSMGLQHNKTGGAFAIEHKPGEFDPREDLLVRSVDLDTQVAQP